MVPPDRQAIGPCRSSCGRAARIQGTLGLPAPVSVLDGCRADVSFFAGMIIDKFAYHQPLYRQHVKLQDSSINVSRAWITKLMPAAVSLLEPIFNVQMESVRRSRMIAMDETRVKAGRAGPGEMKAAAYFWPFVSEQDEIYFLYYPGRAAKHVEAALGLQRPNGAVLQSDVYSAYAHYTKKTGITHAQCWHTHAVKSLMLGISSRLRPTRRCMRSPLCTRASSRCATMPSRSMLSSAPANAIETSPQALLRLDPRAVRRARIPAAQLLPWCARVHL